jgi:hypothetical protein
MEQQKNFQPAFDAIDSAIAVTDSDEYDDSEDEFASRNINNHREANFPLPCMDNKGKQKSRTGRIDLLKPTDQPAQAQSATSSKVQSSQNKQVKRTSTSKAASSDPSMVPVPVPIQSDNNGHGKQSQSPAELALAGPSPTSVQTPMNDVGVVVVGPPPKSLGPLQRGGRRRTSSRASSVSSLESSFVDVMDGKRGLKDVLSQIDGTRYKSRRPARRSVSENDSGSSNNNNSDLEEEESASSSLPRSRSSPNTSSSTSTFRATTRRSTRTSGSRDELSSQSEHSNTPSSNNMASSTSRSILRMDVKSRSGSVGDRPKRASMTTTRRRGSRGNGDELSLSSQSEHGTTRSNPKPSAMTTSFSRSIRSLLRTGSGSVGDTTTTTTCPRASMMRPQQFSARRLQAAGGTSNSNSNTSSSNGGASSSNNNNNNNHSQGTTQVNNGLHVHVKGEINHSDFHKDDDCSSWDKIATVSTL